VSRVDSTKLTSETSFSYQRRWKNANRGKILELIRSKPSTFSELCNNTRLSAQSLSKHLPRLRKEGIISQRVVDGRIEYCLTDRAPPTEELRRRLVVAMIRFVKHKVYHNDSSKFLLASARMAKEAPARFEAEMRFAHELASILETEDYIHWEKKHPNETERQRLLTKELDKKLPNTKFPEGAVEQIAWFGEFLEIVRDTIAQRSSRRHYRQSDARQSTRKAILRVLDDTPCTFGELQKKFLKLEPEEIRSSPTTLSKYLHEFEDEGVVDRRIKRVGKKRPRIEYYLTDEEQRMRRLHNPYFAIPFLVTNYLALDIKGSSVLHELGELARSNPRLVEELLQWYEETMLFFAREDVIHVLQRVPPEAQKRVFDEELRRTLQTIGKTGDLREFIDLLHAFLRDVQESMVQDEEGAST